MENKQEAAFFRFSDVRELEEQELMELYIGKNAAYYSRKWGKSASPVKLSWNWAAFFVSAFWIGYRQMYAYLVVLMGVLLTADIVYVFGLGMEPDIRITILISLLMGIFGNSLYYSHVRKKIRQLRESNLEYEEMKRQAALAGGPNWRGIVATVILLFMYNVILGYLTSLFSGQTLI